MQDAARSHFYAGALCKVRHIGAALGMFAALVSAQGPTPGFSFRTDLPGSFTDISATGALLTAGDDASAPFTCGVTNMLVTTQNLYASTNGVVTTGAFTAFTNVGLPVGSLPFGLFALWDDLYVDGPATLRHQTVIESGVPVEIIQWNQVRLYSGSGSERGDFQVKIFGGGPALVQYVYRDVTFAGGGSSATVGVQWGTADAAQWSLDTQGSVANGSVLSITPAEGLFPRFSSSPSSGPAPLTVQFTDASFTTAVGGITGWQWDLDGNGTVDSTQQHPSFVYTAPGRYHVSLTVSDAQFGSRNETKYFLIDVTSPAIQETEPNESKAQALANGAVVMNHGSRITGRTLGTGVVTPGDFSADTWLIQTAPLPPGIYLHRLVPTSNTLFHTLTLRGRSVSNPATDLVAQAGSAASTPPRYVQWYGFGDGEKVYVRITGTGATTEPYHMTLETTAIAPQSIPAGIAAGNLQINSRGIATIDNEITVYDGQLREILDYQNDDPVGFTVAQFQLNRPFAAGTYYLATAPYQIHSTYPEASATAGSTTHFYPGSLGGERTGPSPNVLDFPGAVCTSGQILTGSNSFRITDSSNTTTTVTAPQLQRFGIQWYRMEVGPPTCASGGHPVITSSPPSHEVALGAATNLTVTATGAAPLSYQWWFNGSPIPAAVGGTSPTLALTNLDPTFTGVYVCQVSNGCGTANSHPCLLSVHLFGPGILQQPVSTTVHCLGEQVTFSVTAFPWFNGALSYQWYSNQLPIPGATSSTLQFPLSGLGDAGQYLCRVTEAGFGFTDSSPASLTVTNAPPVITLNGDYYQYVECHSGTYTELGATATDDCDGTLPVTITGTVDTHVVGYYYLYYTATDSWGNQSSTWRYVYVQDTTPPAVDATIATQVLWSPHHDLIPVGLTAQITDACSDPSWGFPYTWVEVYTNEDELADPGDGSGRHSPDAADWQTYWGTPNLGGLRLRGERSARGNGRIYVVLVYTYDQNWNLGWDVETVVVPNSQSPVTVATLQAQAAALRSQLTATGYYYDALNILWSMNWFQAGVEPQIGPRQ